MDITNNCKKPILLKWSIVFMLLPIITGILGIILNKTLIATAMQSTRYMTHLNGGLVFYALIISLFALFIWRGEKWARWTYIGIAFLLILRWYGRFVFMLGAYHTDYNVLSAIPHFSELYGSRLAIIISGYVGAINIIATCFTIYCLLNKNVNKYFFYGKSIYNQYLREAALIPEEKNLQLISLRPKIIDNMLHILLIVTFVVKFAEITSQYFLAPALFKANLALNIIYFSIWAIIFITLFYRIKTKKLALLQGEASGKHYFLVLIIVGIIYSIYKMFGIVSILVLPFLPLMKIFIHAPAALTNITTMHKVIYISSSSGFILFCLFIYAASIFLRKDVKNWFKLCNKPLEITESKPCKEMPKVEPKKATQELGKKREIPPAETKITQQTNGSTKFWYWLWNFAVIFTASIVIVIIFYIMLISSILPTTTGKPDFSEFLETLLIFLFFAISILFAFIMSCVLTTKMTKKYNPQVKTPKCVIFFRIAIVTFVLLSTTALFLNLIFPHLLLPHQAIVYKKWCDDVMSKNSSLSQLFILNFTGINIIINTIALLGIFYLKRSFKYLYVITLVISIILSYLIFPPGIEKIFDSLNDLSLIVAGIFISLMFYSPVTKYFK